MGRGTTWTSWRQKVINPSLQKAKLVCLSGQETSARRNRIRRWSFCHGCGSNWRRSFCLSIFLHSCIKGGANQWSNRLQASPQTCHPANFIWKFTVLIKFGYKLFFDFYFLIITFWTVYNQKQKIWGLGVIVKKTLKSVIHKFEGIQNFTSVLYWLMWTVTVYN